MALATYPGSVVLGIGLLALAGGPVLADPPAERRPWFDTAYFGVFLQWQPGQARERALPTALVSRARETAPPKIQVKDFNAGAWINLARRSGAKYLMVSAKGRDGLCRFESAHTDYAIQKRDLVAELIQEARRQHVKIGLHYSLPDEHHPDCPFVASRARLRSRQAKPDWQRYLQYVEGQILELCTNYGKIDLLWIDSAGEPLPPAWQKEVARLGARVRDIQPDLVLISEDNVVGTPAPNTQGIVRAGATTITTRPWAVQQRLALNANGPEGTLQSGEEVVRALVDRVSAGNRLLLTVGTAGGKIAPELARALARVGAWLQTNALALEDAGPNPFHHLGFWGSATRKNNTVYLFVYDWPKGRKLYLPELKYTSQVAGSFASAPDQAVDLWLTIDGKVFVGQLPLHPLDKAATVVALKFHSPPVVQEPINRPNHKGEVVLPVLYADLHGRHFHYAANQGNVYLTDWKDTSEYLAWNVELLRPTTFEVMMDYACSDGAAGTRLVVTSAGQVVEGKLNLTPAEHPFQIRRLGHIELGAGRQTVALRVLGVPKGREAALVRGLWLKPVAGPG
jgi:alpha-L-fucosidase